MRFRVWRRGGTAIYLHGGTVAFVAYAMLAGHGLLMAVGMVSIFLHECAHALTSAAFGYPPREVELTPLGAVMRLDEEESVPPGWRLLVLLAGPAMTLLLCTLAIFGVKMGWLPLPVGRVIFQCNVSLLLLNLLPALPLDGGRMLALVLGFWLRPVHVKTILRALGTALGLCCIGLNLLMTWRQGGWNLSLAAAGCFIIYAASTATVSAALAELRGFMDRKIRMERKGITSAHCLTAMESVPLRQAVMMLHPRRTTLYCLLDRELRLRRVLSEEQVIDGYLRMPGERLERLDGQGMHNSADTS